MLRWHSERQHLWLRPKISPSISKRKNGMENNDVSKNCVLLVFVHKYFSLRSDSNLCAKESSRVQLILEGSGWRILLYKSRALCCGQRPVGERAREPGS